MEVDRWRVVGGVGGRDAQTGTGGVDEERKPMFTVIRNEQRMIH